MKFRPRNPPRSFPAGSAGGIRIKDCGTMDLAANEQITFRTKQGAEYDVVRKDWGFYATPSLNGRLKRFGWRSALVKGPEEKYYVFLVEKGKSREFSAYLRRQSHTVVCWLDQESTLRRLRGGLSPKP